MQNARKAEFQRKVKEEEKSRAKEAKQKAEKSDHDAFKRGYHNKVKDMFEARWASAGHPAIQAFTKDEWATALSKSQSSDDGSDLFQRPAIIRNFSDLSEAGVLAKTMQQWKSAFANHAVVQGVTRNQTALTEPQGSAKGAEVFLAVCPESMRVTSPHTSLNTSLKGIYATGFTEFMSAYDFEPQFVGSLRLIHSGEVAWLAAPFSELSAAFTQLNLRPTGNDGSSMSAYDLKQVFEKVEGNCAEEDLSKLKQSVSFHHGRVGPGDVIITPPAWMVAMCTTSQDTGCSGLRQAFLPDSAASFLEVAAFLHTMDPNDDLVQALSATVEAKAEAAATEQPKVTAQKAEAAAAEQPEVTAEEEAEHAATEKPKVTAKEKAEAAKMKAAAKAKTKVKATAEDDEGEREK